MIGFYKESLKTSMKLYSGTDINIEVLNMKFTSIVFEKLRRSKTATSTRRFISGIFK